MGSARTRGVGGVASGTSKRRGGGEDRSPAEPGPGPRGAVPTWMTARVPVTPEPGPALSALHPRWCFTLPATHSTPTQNPLLPRCAARETESREGGWLAQSCADGKLGCWRGKQGLGSSPESLGTGPYCPHRPHVGEDGAASRAHRQRKAAGAPRTPGKLGLAAPGWVCSVGGKGSPKALWATCPPPERGASPPRGRRAVPLGAPAPCSAPPGAGPWSRKVP